MEHSLTTAKHRLLRLLREQQNTDGSFPGTTFSLETDRTETAPTCFHTSLILTALKTEISQDFQHIVSKGIAFLLDQQSANGSWNYWPRNSDASKQWPYPDDLDDTFVALSCIAHYRTETFDEHMLVAAVNLLIGNEVAEGGPYGTWIIRRPKTSSRADTNTAPDIDIAVNSNIACFLREHAIHVPRLEQYIDREIARAFYEYQHDPEQDPHFSSKYYQSPIVIIYFLSRWYDGPHRSMLAAYLRDCAKRWTGPNSEQSTTTEMALAVTALLRFGEPPETIAPLVAEILKACDLAADPTSDTTSNFAAITAPFPFYIERKEEGVTFWSGSIALNAALVFEALSLYGQVLDTPTQPTASDTPAERAKEISGAITNRFSALLPELKEVLAREIATIESADKNFEVRLLPYMIWSELRPDLKERVPAEIVNDLCVANVLGWIGFSIYDDAIDAPVHPDTKDIRIPLANICAREAAHLFQECIYHAENISAISAPIENDLSTTIIEILHQIDEANAWERIHCRRNSERYLSLREPVPEFGNLEHLAQKSLGLALAPMIIMATVAGEKSETIRTFFTHYLIARQLHDDAHDWMNDLEQGAINPVGAAVIRKTLARHPEKRALDLRSDRLMLEKIFWYKTVDDIVALITQHAAQARQTLESLSGYGSFVSLENIITKIESSAERTLHERNQARDFLDAYTTGYAQ